LQKRSIGKTVDILDEPTTGVHFQDIPQLPMVVPGLVDKGHTVIVIELNVDVMKSADWAIDMGAEGGAGGGLVVAEGTPEQVATVPESHTGRFLADLSPPTGASEEKKSDAPAATGRGAKSGGKKAPAGASPGSKNAST